MPDGEQAAQADGVSDELLEAVGGGDAVALADVCCRTLAATWAVGQRLLPSAQVEPLLAQVYAELWRTPPPAGTPVEGWLRGRTWSLGVEALREAGAGPVAPSVRALAPELPAPAHPPFDTVEQALAALEEPARLAVLRAHDLGVPSLEQDDPAAGAALLQGLRVLAAPAGGLPGSDQDQARLADWVLGLLPADASAACGAEVAGDPLLLAQALVLRRGRRRLERLPPPPALAARLVAAVLTETAPAPARVEPSAAPDDAPSAAPGDAPSAPRAPAGAAAGDPYAALRMMEAAPSGGVDPDDPFADLRVGPSGAERDEALPPAGWGRALLLVLLVAVCLGIGLVVGQLLSGAAG